MPYIKKENREKIDSLLVPIKDAKITNCGDLNYVITSIIHNYIENTKLDYTNLNNVIGVLECAKQEYYFRIVRNYEDLKIMENGDIFSKNKK